MVLQRRQVELCLIRVLLPASLPYWIVRGFMAMLRRSCFKDGNDRCAFLLREVVCCGMSTSFFMVMMFCSFDDDD